MAFVTVNNFDVEHASSLLVYENLFPQIQHINGKGCIDKYTKTNDVENEPKKSFFGKVRSIFKK